MPAYHLHPISGEFRRASTEGAFRAERLPEPWRQARLAFAFTVVLNTLFLASDWRFYGDPHFFVAVPARLSVIVAALLGWALLARTHDVVRLQALLLAFQAVVAVAVGLLVTVRTDLALLVVGLLPVLFYLVVPNVFRAAVVAGVGASVATLTGYLVLGENPESVPTTALGLVLGMVLLNAGMLLVVSRSNRMRRLEWAATQRERQSNRELAESRAAFEKMFRTVPIPLVVSERESGAIVAVNDAGLSYFAVSQLSADMRTPSFYEDPQARARLLEALARETRVAGFEPRLRRADGEVRDVMLAASTVEIDGADAMLTAVVDITERKAAEAEIWRAANHDMLTGLPNRAHFQDRLEHRLRDVAATGCCAALLLVDLDGLKEVNDGFGHDAGDAVLVEAAGRLGALARSGDVVARLGGDEFALLAVGAGRGDAVARAEEALAAMRRPMTFGNQALTARASIGVALAPEHDREPGELVKDADLALYAAEQGGRDRIVVYEPALRTGFEGRIQILRETADALDAMLIEPHYQPKVRLDTGALIGFEALARWRHPGRGLIGPGVFGAAFDDPKLAVAIGERMAARIAADLRGWLDAGLPCGRVALNLAPAEFLRGDVVARLLAALESARVPAGRLDIEVTESVFLGTGADAVGAALDAFSAAGMRIALDDFGTGFASLTHLKRFPVDEIKIDQSFVRDVDTDPDDAAIVSAVIDLAEALDLTVTAEGVETHAQAAFLATRGCAQAQGWLYGRPMPADAVARLLRERAAGRSAA
jgi:diguanylate cyclase (GGDEF)-like protein/PAS domain S-box-containing protein